MITLDPDYTPEAAGEHEAYSLMNQAIAAANCEVADYPRLVKDCQKIPLSYTFMVGGVSPTIPKQDVKLRGYVLPDGTLELVAIAHDKDVCVLKNEQLTEETFFMDSYLWEQTAILLFGQRKGKA